VSESAAPATVQLAVEFEAKFGRQPSQYELGVLKEIASRYPGSRRNAVSRVKADIQAAREPHELEQRADALHGTRRDRSKPGIHPRQVANAYLVEERFGERYRLTPVLVSGSRIFVLARGEERWQRRDEGMRFVNPSELPATSGFDPDGRPNLRKAVLNDLPTFRWHAAGFGGDETSGMSEVAIGDHASESGESGLERPRIETAPPADPLAYRGASPAETCVICGRQGHWVLGRSVLCRAHTDETAIRFIQRDDGLDMVVDYPIGTALVESWNESPLSIVSGRTPLEAVIDIVVNRNFGPTSVAEFADSEMVRLAVIAARQEFDATLWPAENWWVLSHVADVISRSMYRAGFDPVPWLAVE